MALDNHTVYLTITEYLMIAWEILFSCPKKRLVAQRGARTHDPEIKSLMLYRLS